ncbi:MAG: TonB-dependent receptor [Chitinophagaceae bacterium]|nr:TonB-dependent receptor [Chitinophagaceae bacterium]
MLKNHLVFSLLVLFCTNVFSQNTIIGKTLAQGEAPLTSAHVHIGKKTVSTDLDGNFIFKNVPSGNTTIHISYVGYQSIDTILTVKNDLKLVFYLKLNNATLNEVLIKQKSSALNKSVFEQKIKMETIEKYSNQTLGDALKEVAGVSSLKSGSIVVKPVINGLYGSRVSVISYNVRLEDQEWGTDHAPNFDINAAGKITVIKGASSLQYSGNAIGGIVIIEPISVKNDSLFGKTILNFDSNGNGGSVSSSIHKNKKRGLSWNALSTLKYIGDKEAPNYVLSNTGNREAAFSGDIKFTGENYDMTSFYSYYKSVIGILSASHTGNVNDLYNSINNQVPSVINDFTYNIKNPKQDVQHHVAKLNFNYHFNEVTSIAFQYSFQLNKRLEFDVRRANYSNIAALDLELKTHCINIDYKRNLHDWSINSGLAALIQNNFANPATGIRPLIPNFDKTDFGIYGIINRDFSDSFSVDAGLRYDFSKTQATKYYIKSRWDERGYTNEFSDFIVGDFGGQWLTKPHFVFNNFSGSIGFRKEFENELNCYVNISTAARNPNPSEFFSDGLHHSTGVIELGDLGLDKEQATKSGITIQKKWNLFSLEINPYINRIQNYIFLKPVGFETTIRGAFPVWEYQQTNARLSGIDIQTLWNITNQWEHLFSFAYVNGKDITANQPLIDMPPLSINNKIKFSKKEWKKLVLELKSEMVFRQNRFPNNNFTTNIIENNEFIAVEVDVSTPPPAYHLLNLYSEIKFKTFKKGITTLAFSVQNILNTKYRDYLNRQRFFADEIGRTYQIQLKINY